MQDKNNTEPDGRHVPAEPGRKPAVTIADSLGPYLANDFGDRFLYEVNRLSFARLAARTVYDSHFGKDFFKENKLYVICGSDSGLLPKYIEQLPPPKGSRFLFVELPEVLARLPEVVGDNPLGPRIAVVSPDGLQDQLAVFNCTEYIYINGLYLIEALCTQDGFLAGYGELASSLREHLEMLNWEIKASLGSKEFVLRQLENLGENQIAAGKLYGLFQGKTAVLLGGGPSLDDLLPWIKENRNRLVVLAVSRIAKRLLEVDLTPDIFFSIDPQPVSFDLSRNMLRFWENSLFINYYHVSPPLLGQWRGRSAYLGPRFPWETPLNESTAEAPGPTVTHIALDTAVNMGFTTIILAGVDLCFTPEGFTHARGSQEYKAGPNLTTLPLLVRTNSGAMAQTSHALRSGIDAMAGQAAAAQERGCTIINPAPGAAAIPNVSHRPAEEIEVAPMEEKPTLLLRRGVPQSTRQTRLKHYKTMRDELLRVKRKFYEIRELALEGLAANKGLFGRSGKQADFSHKKRMDSVEEKLNAHRYDDVRRLVKHFGLEQFMQIIRPDREEDWQDEEIEQVGALYYEAYRDSTDELLALLTETDQRLQVRLLEEDERGDFQKLFTQWRTDLQPGRALLWKTNNPEGVANLRPAEGGLLQELENEFEKILSGTKSLTSQFESSNFNATAIKSKINTFFRRKDIRELGNMVTGLARHGSSEAPELAHYAEGCLAELKEDFPAALDAYGRILENQESSLIEDTLRRIGGLSLHLHDADNAVAALECLSGISPTYLPQLADLLWLLGRRKEALDLYADYLEKIPGDIARMLKLGYYYRELNMPEGVRMAVEYVLATDPANQGARELLASMNGTGEE